MKAPRASEAAQASSLPRRTRPGCESMAKMGRVTGKVCLDAANALGR
jgi:hypothetical protein